MGLLIIILLFLIFLNEDGLVPLPPPLLGRLYHLVDGGQLQLEVEGLALLFYLV